MTKKLHEPSARQCHYCDFSSGHRGMDWCSKCDGTGSIFVIGGHIYPNTKEGYKAAKNFLNGRAPNYLSRGIAK